MAIFEFFDNLNSNLCIYNYRVSMRYKLMVFIILGFFSVFTYGMSEDTENEISHLFNYLKGSSCQFNRNGTWYTASEAADHINTKYQNLLKRDLIKTTEDFIDRAASKSSMSGKPYLVKCNSSDSIESSIWFSTELNKYRHKAN